MPMSSSEHRIYFLLQRAAHCLKKEADRNLLSAAGLTTSQAAVLMLVAESSHATQKTIAVKLQQNESAITAMTARLLRDGFVARTRDPDDARSWSLRLTPAGKKALGKLRKPFAEINAAMDGALGARSSGRLARQLRSIIAEFSDGEPFE